MAKCPIVVPRSVRVTLPDGEWVDLKAELNAGEYRDMLASQFKENATGSDLLVDFKNVGRGRVIAYLLAWSYVDPKDQPLPANAQTLDAVDTDTFKAILDAVDTHHAQVEAARSERKNAQGGEIVSSSISTSAA